MNDHAKERHAMMRPFFGEKGDAIRRAVEANRAVYDCARPPPGKVAEQVTALEAALTQTQDKLRAIEGSTIWKSTRQLRQFVQAIKNLRQTLLKAATRPENAAPSPVVTYQDWIDVEEPAVIRRLLSPGAGHMPVTDAHLGLVVWTDEKSGSIVAEKLVAELSKTPDTCDVLLMCSEAHLVNDLNIQEVVRPNLMVESGIGFAEMFPAAMRRMKSTHVCFHNLADNIAPHALEIVAVALAGQAQTDLLFGDEDWLDKTGQRSRPFFKPGWDFELQRGQDLIGPFAFYRMETLQSLANFTPSGPAWRYDLAGRIAAACQPERVRHIPAVLCHRRAPLPEGIATAMRQQAKMHLLSQGIAAAIDPMDGPEPWHRVVYSLPQPAPHISIIVPTRDRAELLKDCTDGILRQTNYLQIELIIVDNGTEEADALALLEVLSRDGRVKILRRPGSFNWSALNNAAAAASRGEILILLNNDISVMQPSWLEVLAALVIQPDVGAVGAKLLYQDGRVQHAGITTDMHGVPRHLFRYSKPDDAGPSGMLALARSVWAVTGACLAIRRDVFFEVGGLNENLPVAYNDVDLCMRLTIKGYRIVWTPNAVLEHREFASRPPDHFGARREQVREELNRLTRDWGNLIMHDPFLSPNYELVQERLAFRTGSNASDAGGGV